MVGLFESGDSLIITYSGDKNNYGWGMMIVGGGNCEKCKRGRNVSTYARHQPAAMLMLDREACHMCSVSKLLSMAVM